MNDAGKDDDLLPQHRQLHEWRGKLSPYFVRTEYLGRGNRPSQELAAVVFAFAVEAGSVAQTGLEMAPDSPW